ncbi:response regulator [Gemmobacter aquarius]|uniref:Response regulator n=1 Tax=Paragemmobacter aquarius TaxID=2169400 RepID=A0A2S0UJZ0_9RHOB|nr:response regulator [Gemmobacter aquarius]
MLVVEDESLIAMDLQSTLESWGCIVLGPFASAKATLLAMATGLPDTAVLDVHIRDGTSEPVAGALLKTGTGFVVLTAFRARDMTGALKTGRLIRKPLDPARLHRELEACLPLA